MNVLYAEWIKLRSTRSFWWTNAVVIVLSLALSMIMGLGQRLTYNTQIEDLDGQQEAIDTIKDSMIPSPELMVSGVQIFGLVVIMIMGALIVTSEYRFNTIRTTFAATPQRWKVMVAKLALYGVIAAAIVAALVPLSVAATKLTAGPLAEGISFRGETLDRLYWTLPLYAFFLVMLAIAVGTLVRQTAGAVSLLLLWQLVVEGLLVSLIPKVREWLPPFMPFGNMSRFVSGQEGNSEDWHWDPTGSGLYFMGFCLVLYIIATIVVSRRDA